MAQFADLRTEEYLSYPTERYPFRELLRRMLEYDDLDHLERSLPPGVEFPPVTFENDQSTYFHKKFYGSPLLDDFLALYHRFVREQVAPMFADRRIVYQARPTFRVSLPHNVAVGQKHRDGDYHHPRGEINFWLPFSSRVWDSNGFYVESAPDRGDYHPVSLAYGQMFRFYGNQCWHYNEVNQTGVSRVSIDFRVVPGSEWRDDEVSDEARTVKSHMKFRIGSYYTEYVRPETLS